MCLAEGLCPWVEEVTTGVSSTRERDKEYKCRKCGRKTNTQNFGWDQGTSQCSSGLGVCSSVHDAHIRSPCASGHQLLLIAFSLPLWKSQYPVRLSRGGHVRCVLRPRPKLCMMMQANINVIRSRIIEIIAEHDHVNTCGLWKLFADSQNVVNDFHTSS